LWAIDSCGGLLDEIEPKQDIKDFRPVADMKVMNRTDAAKEGDIIPSKSARYLLTD
jgi:hypothetical protein